jgi:hypothetical protein
LYYFPLTQKKENCLIEALIYVGEKSTQERERKIIQHLYDYPSLKFCPTVHVEYPCFGQVCLSLICCSPINSGYFIFHISIDIPTEAANTQPLQSQPQTESDNATTSDLLPTIKANWSCKYQVRKKGSSHFLRML